MNDPGILVTAAGIDHEQIGHVLNLVLQKLQRVAETVVQNSERP